MVALPKMFDKKSKKNTIRLICAEKFKTIKFFLIDIPTLYNRILQTIFFSTLPLIKLRINFSLLNKFYYQHQSPKQCVRAITDQLSTIITKKNVGNSLIIKTANKNQKVLK